VQLLSDECKVIRQGSACSLQIVGYCIELRTHVRQDSTPAAAWYVPMQRFCFALCKRKTKTYYKQSTAVDWKLD
jgi:hypothetical protein